MAFLNPWLLLTLPVAVIPLLLHLWMSRRVRVVELSTFRFLFDSYVQQRRRLKFLEALVAALRTLFLLVLVLVVTRPVVKHWSSLFGGGSGRNIIVMVDCSASMQAHTDGVSSLDRAKTAARAIADRMGRGDRLSLIRVAAEPEELFGRFHPDAEKIGLQIDALETDPSGADLFGALNLVSSRKADQAPNAVVYFLTDCQAGEWRDLRDEELAPLLPEDARFVVVNVGSGGTSPNCAVVGSGPRNPRAVRGLPVILRPKVANYSATKVNDLPLSVFIDEKEIGRIRVTLDPGQVAERDVVYVPQTEGVLKGRFEIPRDRFPDDDTFLFTLAVVPQLNVLLVRPTPADPADRQQDEALYLRAALSADAQSTDEFVGMIPSEDLMRSLHVRETGEPELNADRLRDVSLVILANCGGLDAGQFALLRDFTFKGGGLLILPGDRVNGATYNDQLFAVPGRPEERLIPTKLGEAQGDPENAETFERFSDIDFGHPVMSVFDDPDEEFLRTVRFFRRFQLEMTRAKGDDVALARFADASPAVVESRYGEGRTALAAFPANTRWSNLPMKPEFVPLVLRLVDHLARKPELECPSVVAAGRPTRITADPSWAPATGKVEDSFGHASPLNFQWSGTRLLSAFEATTRKGYYTVEVTGRGDAEEARRGALSFAVNLAQEESDFKTVGENQLREWLHSDDLAVVDASAQMQHLKGSIGDEREIWRPLIYLTFLIIGGEFLLSTSSGHRRTSEERHSLVDRVRRMSPTTWVRAMTGGSEFTE